MKKKSKFNKVKPKKRLRDKFCDPSKCEECVYIGDGDFLCTKYNEIVLSDWEPTDDFLKCIKE